MAHRLGEGFLLILKDLLNCAHLRNAIRIALPDHCRMQGTDYRQSVLTFSDSRRVAKRLLAWASLNRSTRGLSWRPPLCAEVARHPAHPAAHYRGNEHRRMSIWCRGLNAVGGPLGPGRPLRRSTGHRLPTRRCFPHRRAIGLHAPPVPFDVRQLPTLAVLARRIVWRGTHSRLAVVTTLGCTR